MSKKTLPSHIKDKMTELRRIETELGHLPPETWAVNELQRRVADPEFAFHSNQMEQQTELLFGDICDELSEIGYSPDEIAGAINQVLQYPGGPRYCSSAEVSESLGLENS